MSDSLIIFFGTYVIWIEMVLVAAFFLVKSEDRKRDVFLGLISVILAYLLARFSSLFYYHTQPYDVFNFKPIIYHEIDNAFPSDHVGISSVLASLVLLRNWKFGLPLFVLVVLICVGRVYGGVHHPIDVLAGVVVGLIAAIVGNFILKKY